MLLLITNLGKGGAQRVFHDHSVAFSSLHQVQEAVFDVSQDDRIYNSGLPLHDLKRVRWLYRCGVIGRLVCRVLTLRRLVASHRYDVVISHMDGANWINVLSFSKARKILVVHGTVLCDANVPPFRQWVRRKLIFPWLYNLADKTVAVSQGIEYELSVVCGVRNVSAIPNFFERSLIATKALEPLPIAIAPIFDGPPVLITSGRLAEQKKQFCLIKLVADLRLRDRSARLVILGDGELRQLLLRQCETLGLRTFQIWNSQTDVLKEAFDVYFLGYVANPYQYLARSTLFLFPSAWEGFPLALCEAMISGVPVMSSDCPTGPREILAPNTRRNAYDLRTAELAENGVLLPMIESAQDLRVWVEAVEHLLSSAVDRERLRVNASHAMEGLDREAIVGRWLHLIEEVYRA